ncbi:MAG: hypothetical protein LBG13_03090 [Holosporales bacterium]|jgi:hypothetical protein|nr:hypothetical protein [Holosporales bacterium]
MSSICFRQLSSKDSFLFQDIEKRKVAKTEVLLSIADDSGGGFDEANGSLMKGEPSYCPKAGFIFESARVQWEIILWFDFHE